MQRRRRLIGPEYSDAPSFDFLYMESVRLCLFSPCTLSRDDYSLISDRRLSWWSALFFHSIYPVRRPFSADTLLVSGCAQGMACVIDRTGLVLRPSAT